MNRHWSIIIVFGLGWMVAGGCGEPKVESPQDPLTSAEVLGETVGTVCELVDYEGVRVQGHSLVWGLQGTGSSECPVGIRKYLVQYLQQINAAELMGGEYAGWTAERIITSKNTAVVRVSGVVPAAAPSGEQFDVEVRVVPATQTQSLQGGILLPTDLQVVLPGRSGQPLARKRTATAAGPIFINPFGATTTEEKVDPRRGMVLGGGRSLFNRQVSLLLLEPDGRRAQQIERRVNTRFGLSGRQNPSEAKDRSLVVLRVPDEYRENYQHFFSLVSTLYLQDRAGYLEYKLQQLVDLAKKGDADYETIALAWEGIGKDSLRYLPELWEHESPELSFYAARTALRLKDLSAIDTLATIALTDGHPKQLEAAKMLVEVPNDARAKTALIELLNTGKSLFRVVAYEGLQRSQDPRVKSMALPGGFKLETVNSTGENLLCVWATADPRIILIGENWQCTQNVFYESDDGLMAINAGPDDQEFTLIRQRAGREGFISLKCPLDVRALIVTLANPIDPKNPTGAGLSFSQIVGILHDLSDEQIIPTKFVLHRRGD